MLLRIQGFLGCDAGLRSSGMRCYVTVLVFRNTLQECDALVPEGFLESLKKKASHSFETLRNTNPATQHHIQVDLGSTTAFFLRS
jgi:hypothetical protein